MSKRANYQEYLNSEAWSRIAAAVRKRARHRCERCKERPVDDVHHLTYQRLGQERMTDLIALCRLCHRAEHGDAAPAVLRHTERQLQKAYR